MTNFDNYAPYGGPRQQSARFSVAGVDYEVFFTEITKVNLWDSAVDFPKGFNLPQYAKHFDVTFDTKANRVNQTYFKRAENLPAGAGTRVLKCVERVIVDHYTTFNVGLYTFAPADSKLSSVYCRLIMKSKHKGSSIEVGLEPEGKANVLRTPKFYD